MSKNTEEIQKSSEKTHKAVDEYLKDSDKRQAEFIQSLQENRELLQASGIDILLCDIAAKEAEFPFRKIDLPPSASHEEWIKAFQEQQKEHDRYIRHMQESNRRLEEKFKELDTHVVANKTSTPPAPSETYLSPSTSASTVDLLKRNSLFSENYIEFNPKAVVVTTLSDNPTLFLH